MCIADHVVKGRCRTDILGQLRPDLHPVTILAVDALTTDLELDHLDEAVSDGVEPAEAFDTRLRHRQVDSRQHNLDVRTVHQVGITIDHGRHTLVEVGLAVERHLNGLQGKVRMALV